MSGQLRLSTPLSQTEVLKPPELKSLAAAGIAGVGDLLHVLPRRHEDRRVFDRFDSYSSNRAVCLRVQVEDVQWKQSRAAYAKHKRYVEVSLVDRHSLGQVRFCALWFHMPAIKHILCVGQELIVYGTIKPYGKKLGMIHPDFEIITEHDEQSVHLNRIVPVYTGKFGINPRRMREIMWQILQCLSNEQEPDVMEFVETVPYKTALRQLHFPDSKEQATQIRRRFALEECLYQQLTILYRRKQAQENPGLVTAGTSYLVQDLVASLDFELTPAQKRSVREIYRDMKTPRAMNRLLQGDVGSGKTLVALCAMLLAVEHGYVAVMMAPTQILAEQHYLKFRKILQKLDVPVSLITGDRKEIAPSIHGTQGAIIIGTHALLYGKHLPENIGLIVIDEQHKFGVKQREKLISRPQNRPDVLVMTATPIPRTLTLSFYGELDVSVLDTLPQGRGQIITAVRTAKEQKKVTEFIRLQLEQGRQIYIISPLIDGDESQKRNTVAQDLQHWQEQLPDYEIAMLHGKMSAEQKDAVMRDFYRNRIQVLVSTTVVEVGVDVPNATVMLINNAETFGLSQLHQLRGRIGRGKHKSYCILMTQSQADDEQREKLKIIESTLDGFELAEQDLRLRGPGDVLGTTQSGLNRVQFDEWLTDTRLISRARRLAEDILQSDPLLSSPKYRPLRHLLDLNASGRVTG